MKHSKIFGLMLCMLLWISLLAGCGNTGNSQPNHSETLANVSQAVGTTACMYESADQYDVSDAKSLGNNCCTTGTKDPPH